MIKNAIAALTRALSSFLCFLSFIIYFSAELSAQIEAPRDRDVDYAYDELGRLKTVTYIGLSSDGGNIVYTYQYDPAGNRTSVTVSGSSEAIVFLQDAYGLEGGVISFPVFVGGIARQAGSINWSVVSGSQHVVVQDRTGTLAIDAIDIIGQVVTLDLQLVDNGTKDGVSQVVVEISSPVSLTIDPANNSATGFVQDNDVTHFTISEEQVFEGSNAIFTVTKVTPPSAVAEDVTVTFTAQGSQDDLKLTASRGQDFSEAVPLSEVFLTGDSSKTVTINTYTDSEREYGETLRLKADWTTEGFVSATGALGTIYDTSTPGGTLDGPSAFAVQAVAGLEGETVNVVVSRPAPLGRVYNVSLDVVGGTATGSDYAASFPQVLQFAQGVPSVSVPVLLVDDEVGAGNSGEAASETVALQVAWSDAENGAQTSQGVLTINDNGNHATSPSDFVVSNVTGTEGNNVTVNVSRSGPMDRAYTVTLDRIGGTATPGDDYSSSLPATLQFGIGEPSKPVIFSLVADREAAPQSFEAATETITLQASWADPDQGARTANGTVSIQDDGDQRNRAPVANSDVASTEMPLVALISISGGEGDIIVPEADPAVIPAGYKPFYQGGINVDVTANDADLDGDNLSVTSVSLHPDSEAPLQGPSIVPGNKRIEALFTQCGTYVFNYTVSDGAASANSTLTVTTTAEGDQCEPAGTAGSGSTSPGNPTPSVQFSGAAPTVEEGGELSYTVSLSNSYSSRVYVDWTAAGTAVEGSDYTLPTNRRIVFPSGATSRAIKVLTEDARDVVDGDRTLILTLSSPSTGTLGANTSMTGTIQDNDAAGNSSPLAYPDYINNLQMVDLGIGNSFSGDVSINVLANDSDPEGHALTLENTLRLAPGYEGVYGLNVNSNGLITGAVTQCGRYRFEYDVRDALGARSTSFLDIRTTDVAGCPTAIAPLDEPVPAVSISGAGIVTEGGALSFPVALSKSYPDPVAITWSVTAGADEVSGSASGILNFNVGDPLTKTIVLATTNDGVYEPSRTVTITLSGNPINAELGSPSAATGTINDDDPHLASFAVSGESALENVPTRTFTVTRTGNTSSSATVNYAITSGGSATQGTDWQAKSGHALSGTLQFNPGVATRTVQIDVINDSIWERAESVTMTLSTPSSNAEIVGATSKVWIDNDDGEPMINLFNNGKQEGNSNSTLNMTVFLQGGTTEVVTVTVQTRNGTATAGSDYVAVSNHTVTIQPGSYEATVPVTILGDTTVESDEYFHFEVVSATNARTATSGVKSNGDGTNGVGNIRNDDSYSYYWQYGSYGGWSACTGQSTQSRSRSATCKRSDGATVSGSYCGSASTTQYNSCSYGWQYGSWSGYGACQSNNTQTRTRSATCKSSTGHTVSSSKCGSATTSESRSCSYYSYTWNTGSWSAYSACTGQSHRVRTRSVTCKRSPGGATVSGSYCSGSKPATSETGSACSYSYSWHTGNWTDWTCTDFGNAATRTRSVSCKVSSGGTVSDSYCSGTKPAGEQVTSLPSCAGGGPGF